MVKIAINGFGRIGRLVTRVALQRDDIQLVAVNDIGNLETCAHLLKYDSVHGICPLDIKAGQGVVAADSHEIKVFSERDPDKIPWNDLGVEVVIESTGRFTKKSLAQAHLHGSVKRVLVTAPAAGADYTIVMGVNHEGYDPARHFVVSNASCTTNCLAPVAKVLNDEFGIIKGFMTTVHSYTNDQRILDLEHKDLRRARAGGVSIVPTTTGAAKAIGLVIPELDGKLNGTAMRVPTPNVSVVDLVVEMTRPASAEEVNHSFLEASKNRLKGIMQYCDLPLVSRDFNGNPHSAVIDALSTMTLGGNMAKVIAWYDNEWAYSNRVIDTVSYMAECGI